MEIGGHTDDFEWYEDYFDDVRLNYRDDGEWFSSLANRPFGPNALKSANQVAIRGSWNLKRVRKDEEPAIIAARKEFFETILGWGDTDHPLHATYVKFARTFPYLKQPSTVIAAIRTLHEHGVDTTRVVKRSSELLALNPYETEERIDYLTGIGVLPKTIQRNPGILTYPVSFVERFVERMSAKGFDPVYIINNSLFALGSKDELLDTRIDALTDMGLDPVQVINSNANVLNIRSELIHSKLLTVRAILRYINSPISAEEFVNQRPLALCRNQEKVRASVRMLHDSVDHDYIASLNAVKLYGFVMMPLDSILAAIAMQKSSDDFAPDGITVAHIARMRVKTPKPERRQQSIDILRDEPTRRLIGKHVVRAYLRSAPFTAEEIEQYPELSTITTATPLLQNRM